MNKRKSIVLASASALTAGVAQGSIVYSGPLNLQQAYNSADSSNSRQAINMGISGTNDFTFGYDANNLKPYVDTRTSVSTQIPGQSGLMSLFEKPGSKGFPVTPAGTMIDATYAASFPTNFARGYMYQDDTQTVAGDWSNTAVTDAFVGFELALSGGISYGWLHFIDDPNATTLTLVDWSYESTPGVGIQTIEVPEPSTCALVGLGVAALIARKRHHANCGS